MTAADSFAGIPLINRSTLLLVIAKLTAPGARHARVLREGGIAANWMGVFG